MNEQMIEAALERMSMLMPRAPTDRVENMVRTVNLLAKKRAERMGQTADPVSRRKALSPPTREKDKNKTL